MTDQSRVEAVADVLARELGRHRLAMIRLAEDVVEANDAWLKERGWEPGQKGYSRYAMFAGIHRNPEEPDR